MPVNRGPGVRQIGTIGTTPKEHRLALAGQYAENAPGVPRSGLLVQAATNVVTPTAATGTMTYLVAEVASVIGRGVGDGVYTPTTVGATIANRTVATAASPASGSRWDLVWIKQNDQEKGDANNEAILGVTSGSAAASPVRPTGSVPAGALVLSEHQIFSGAASATAAPNTTTQLFLITAARGAPTPVRNVAERDTITSPATGQAVTRLDLTGTPQQTWTGTKWGGGPRGQLAQTQNTFNTLFGTTLNFIAEATVTVEPDRWIQVTAQSEASSDTAGLVAAYFLKVGGASGAATGTQLNVTNKRYQAAALGEGLTGFSARYNTGAGGPMRFSLQGQTVVTAGLVSSITGATKLVIDDVGPA